MKVVLCDSTTINSYGFRTDVKGIDLERFKKNPVMLYNHNPLQVIGKWENIDIFGDQLIAEPVFDMEDPFAAEIARKMKQGFIKGCSMGIVIKNLTQTKGIDTATNSVLLEASIVSIPADENALVVYEDEKQQKKLSINEFNKLFYQMEANKNNKPIDNSQLTIDNLQAELAAKNDIISDLSAQIDELRKDLAEREYHEAEVAINAFVEKGIIKEDVKSIALAFYLQNPKDTITLFESIAPSTKAEPQPQISLSTMLKQSNGTPQRTWDDLDRAGELQRLKAVNPEEFRRLFFEKFGKEYINN